MPQLETGVYEGEVLSHGLTVTKKAGYPQVWMEINVFGQINADGSKFDFPAPVRRTVYMLLTEKSAKWTAQDLAALGFDGQPSQIDEGDPNHISLVGKRANFYNKYDGEWENWRVSRPNSGGSTTARVKMDAPDLMNVNNLFGSHFNTAATGETDTGAAPDNSEGHSF